MSTEEGDQMIVSSRYQTGVLKKMKSLREKSTLCDVTLQVDDVKIAAHKVVLASASPFFEFMFTAENIKESKMDCIEIKDVCPFAFSALIDFMYTGYLFVKDENIVDLLTVADRLKITDAKIECLSYLQKHINISNCILIRNIAGKHFFTELEKKVNWFICFNFNDVIKTEGFFSLSLDEMEKFITEESFCASSILCEQAISAWVEYDEGSRKKFLDELTQTARIYYERLYKRGDGMYNALQQKQLLFSTKETTSNEVVFLDLNNLSCRSTHRRPSFKSICSIFHKNAVCIIGEKTNECAVYNLEKEEWNLNKIPFNNNYSGGCSIHDQIYLISSYDSGATYSYDMDTNTLQVQPSLMNNRTFPGVTFDGCCVFVCGGGTASVQRRDLRTKEWRSISDLPKRMDICSATSLNQQVYCAFPDGSFYQYNSCNGIWIEKAKICSNDGSEKKETNQHPFGTTSSAFSSQNPAVLLFDRQQHTKRFMLAEDSIPVGTAETTSSAKLCSCGNPNQSICRPVVLGSNDQFVYAYNGQSLYKYVPALNEWESITKKPGYTDFVCVYPEF